ncbi:MAG: ribonuclease HII [Chloroflexota bacterium]
MVKGLPPTLEEERGLLAQGYSLVAGVDEVGRGALAGPVAAAAVVLPLERDLPWFRGVRDSKLLTPKQREDLFPLILEQAVSVGVALVPVEDIDGRGILRATRLAMRLALERMSLSPQFLLIDGMRLPQVRLPQKGIVRGDRLCLSIACASIVAKVTRDRVMVELDGQYPGYGLAAHKGYGTREHLSCLQSLGASPIHRRSFAPVRRLSALV